MPAPLAPPIAPSVPAAYARWRGHARALLEPLAALMEPGRADIPLPGRPSDHDAQADRLESFARPLFLAALYLQSTPEPADDSAAHALREKLTAWFRAGLALGTDPASPEYWGPDANYHQHHVEMGLMALALQIARAQLWEPLAASDRARVCTWFATARGGGIVNNNHLFMSVHILEFLGTVDAAHRTDRAIIDAHLTQLETMHRGGGWFEDGINQAYDHYNAFAFHFYGLFWALLHGKQNPARAERWRGWAAQFLDDYQHFFAASGEHPAFGRSLTYRFNASAPFALALAAEATDLPPGRLRRLCTHNLEFFLARPIRDAVTGTLAPGFTDVWPEIVEPYSCPGSPYWCAKGFAPLLLPPTHPFWSAPEEPLPAESPAGFVRVMPLAAGLVVRSLPDGEVELLNAGSMVSNGQLRYGAWKWSKLSYRTGAGFTYAFPEPSNWSVDGALVARLDDGRVFGRHSTTAVELAPDHLGFACNFGFKVGQANIGVETFVFWRAGWILHVHHVAPRQPAAFSLGGFALPLASPEVERAATGDRLVARSREGRASILQLLAPRADATPAWDERLDDASPRRHTHAPRHVTPVFDFSRRDTAFVVAALAWTGANESDEAQPWHIVSAEAENWLLRHPALGDWRIRHWSLPSLTTR
jgi:Uncharacterized protein conserved in bacteria